MQALFRVMLLVAVAALWSSGSARAEWPNDKAIRMMVPFAAGGGTDHAGRLIAKHLADRLNQTVYVENRAGANGIVGLQQLKQAPADGYTLMTCSDGPLIYNPALYKERLPYDTLRDFTPIGMIVNLPPVLVIHPSVPARSLSELIRLAKDKPGSLNYSSSGYGGSSHLGIELLMKSAGISMVHVPTTGTAPATLAVVQGGAQLHFSNLSNLQPLIDDGKLIGLGTGAVTRIKTAPGIPPIADTLPGFDMAPWISLIGPPGLPKEISKRLSHELVAILTTPDVVAGMEKVHQVAWPMPSEEFAAFLAKELAKWTKIIDDAGIKLKQ